MKSAIRNSDIIAEIAKKATNFNKNEIEKLVNFHKKSMTVCADDAAGGVDLSAFRKVGAFSSTGTSGTNQRSCSRQGIDRLLFREILHNTFHILSEDVIMDRIFNFFDKRCDGIIQADEWVQGLSVLLKGSLQERISYTFFVYDLNSDGVITKDEIHTLLRNALLKLPHDDDPDESVKDLTELCLKKLDDDKDNKVSFSDFEKSVHKDPLLLEALGQCLPSEDDCKNFLSKI